MANNLNQSLYQEKELDLIQTIKRLIESKKLIISSILIFTIIAILYSITLKTSFKSSAIFKVSYYEMPDGSQKKIESLSSLINNLEEYKVFENQSNEFAQAVKIKPIKDTLVRIETTSISAGANEKLLKKFFSYINERHTKLTELKYQEIINNTESKYQEIINQIELEQLESDLAEDLRKNNLLLINKKINLLEELIIIEIGKAAILKNEPQLYLQSLVDGLDYEEKEYKYKLQLNELEGTRYKILTNNVLKSNKLTNLLNIKKDLENEIKMLRSKKITQTLPSDIKTESMKPDYNFIISLGLIFGFFAGIFLALSRNFIMALKET
jgi:LPS O-antigen subunit length determinant protein (WzzB/FepE family)